MQKALAVLGGIGSLFVLIFVLASVEVVEAGERAVVLRFGEVREVKEEGLYWRNPFTTDFERLDVKTLKIEVEASSASRDLQSVKTVIALNYSLKAENVGLLWKEIGREYQSRVVDPAIQEAVKASTAKFNAEELITKRSEVRDNIGNLLTQKLSSQHIQVKDVAIVDFKFSDSFNAAIEAKVTAEQKALESKNKLEQIKYEAEQRIAQAEAEARAIRLQSDAANNEKYIALKQLEVQMEFAKRWNGSVPQTVTPNSAVPFFSVSK